MTHHILKSKPQYWFAKQGGDQSFEVRNNDRNFQVGDTVSYAVQRSDKWCLQPEVYEITYILTEYQLEGYVTFSEKLIDVDADRAKTGKQL